MTYLNPEIKHFKGLHLQRNSFEVPDGALEEAENCVMYSDSIIEKCRGFYEYSDDFNGTVEGMTNFSETLVSSNTDAMFYYTDTGESPNITGTGQAIGTDDPVDFHVSDIPSRFAQSNGNLYTTTDNGVIKLTNFDSILQQSGAPQGLDLSSYFSVGFESSVLDPIPVGSPPTDWIETSVMYRVLFGYQDANNNLVIGAPSSPITISNPIVEATYTTAVSVVTVTSLGHGLVTGMVMKFFDATTAAPAADPNADGTYSITRLTADTFSYTTISVPTGPNGTLKYAYAMQPTLEFSIPSECSEQVQWFYEVYRSSKQPVGQNVSDYRSIIKRPIPIPHPSPAILVVRDAESNFSGTPLYTNQNSGEGELQANARPPLCQDIATFQGSMFYANTTARNILNFSVIDPPGMVEGVPNSTYSYLDLAIDSLRRRYLAVTGAGNNSTLGICSTGIGDLIITCQDDTIANLHGYVNYGLITLFIDNVYGPGNTIQNGIYYLIYDSTTTFKISSTIGGSPIQRSAETSLYFQAIQFPQPTVTALSWTRVGNEVTISYTDHNLYTGMQVYLSASTGAVPIATGLYSITVFDEDTIIIDSVAADSFGTISLNAEQYCFRASSGSQATPTALTTAGQDITITAQCLVKSINRDPQSIIYADYVSVTTTDLGDIVLQSKGFGDTIYMYASDYPTGQAVFPQLPFQTQERTSAALAFGVVTVTSTSHGLVSGQQVYIDNASESVADGGSPIDNINGLYTITAPTPNTFTFIPTAPPVQPPNLGLVDYFYQLSSDSISSVPQGFPNGLMVSKQNEPEAVPLINILKVGSEKSAIRRIHALSNALIILKDDGVFRLTGDNVSNFSVSILDNTVKIIAFDSSVVLNNQVVLLSNQGVAMTNETSVRIVSRVIDDVIQSILNNGAINTATHAISNEVDRIYLLSTITPDYEAPAIPDPIRPNVLYAYNIMTESWTTWQWTFTTGCVGPNNIVYLVDSTTENINRERKDNKKTDYTGQNYHIEISTVTDEIYADVLSIGYVPEYGDFILKDNIVNIIKDVIHISGNRYVLQFFYSTNLVGGRQGVAWSRTTNVVTVTSVDHGLSTGDSIYINNVTGTNPPVSAYYSITVINSDTFTFGSTAPDGSGVLDYYEDLQIYSGYPMTMKFSPYHGGLVGKSKQFCQLRANFRSPDCTAATLTFAGDTYDTSEDIEWEEVITEEGWGLFPWGLVPWGQQATIDLPTGTQAASIMRTYIPSTAARGTFIQPVITNDIAGDRVSLQSLGYDVRAYGTRPSK